MGWTVRRSYLGRGEIFRADQTGPEAHPASCRTNVGSSLGVKWAGIGADRPHSFSADFE